MTEFLTTNALVTLGYALAAILALFWMLRVLDQLGKVDFKTTMRGIAHDPKAAALYFGLRFVGACLLLGSVIS